MLDQAGIIRFSSEGLDGRGWGKTLRGEIGQIEEHGRAAAVGPSLRCSPPACTPLHPPSD